MRTIALCSLILAAVFAIDARTGAQAAWCAQYFNGGTNCGFSNLQQCLETVRGIGGQCGPDGSGGSVERSRPLSERREARPPREPKQKPVATAPRPRPAIEREATEPRRPVAVEPPRPATPPPVAEPAPTQPTNSFAAGRALILSGKYEAAITALRALGYDDHPDIAASTGFANAKLGRLDEARLWYEKALAADPNHISALAYYGMLRAQQGDVTTARANLEKVRTLCGGAQCLEYQDLAGALAAQAR
jgi:tetratricopeptide (TPR) repeat protein